MCAAHMPLWQRSAARTNNHKVRDLTYCRYCIRLAPSSAAPAVRTAPHSRHDSRYSVRATRGPRPPRRVRIIDRTPKTYIRLRPQVGVSHIATAHSCWHACWLLTPRVHMHIEKIAASLAQSSDQDCLTPTSRPLDGTLSEACLTPSSPPSGDTLSEASKPSIVSF